MCVNNAEVPYDLGYFKVYNPVGPACAFTCSRSIPAPLHVPAERTTARQTFGRSRKRKDRREKKKIRRNNKRRKKKKYTHTHTHTHTHTKFKHVCFRRFESAHEKKK